MKITVLGTGTSTGVPVPGCDCTVCTSDNPKNRRFRCSVHITLYKQDVSPSAGNSVEAGKVMGTILIDTSPDLRSQALKFKIKDVRAVLYTHAHADHCHGIDDLRVFNFINKERIAVFAADPDASELEEKFSYVFKEDPRYQGGATAKLDLQKVSGLTPFELFGVDVLPVPIFHGRNQIMGFRIGNFAYLTDCSKIPEESIKHLLGLEQLIIDGLRDRPHPTHMTLDAALEQIKQLSPKQAWLTHISHELEHSEANQRIKNLGVKNVELAYDGLELSSS